MSTTPPNEDSEHDYDDFGISCITGGTSIMESLCNHGGLDILNSNTTKSENQVALSELNANLVEEDISGDEPDTGVDVEVNLQGQLPQVYIVRDPDDSKGSEEQEAHDSDSSTLETSGSPNDKDPLLPGYIDVNGNPRFNHHAPPKLTNDEFVKWMNYDLHYLAPTSSSSPLTENSESLKDDADTELEAPSSTFQVTLRSLGTTIDLAGGCKTPSSTGTPPPPPESLPESITPKEATSAVSVPDTTISENENDITETEVVTVVSQSVTETASAVQEVSQSVTETETSSAVKEISQSVTETASAVKEVSQSVTETISTSREVSPTGIETISTITEVSQSGSETISAVREVAQSATETISVVREVAQSQSGTETTSVEKEVCQSGTEITPVVAPATTSVVKVAKATPSKTTLSTKTSKQTNGTGGGGTTTKSNASGGTPTKTTSTGAVANKKPPTKTAAAPVKAAGTAATTGGSPARPASRRGSSPQTPTTPNDDANASKKVPMNKVKVGTAPSPNIKEVKSKIGSLGSVSGTAPPPKKPPTTNVKIPEQKLNWNAQSKVGSFNTGYVRQGGNVKVKAEPVKKAEVKQVASKIGSWNVAYKPGGGEKKIFDDKQYLKKTHSNSSSEHGGGGASGPTTPRPPSSSATNGNGTEVPPPVDPATGEGNSEQKLIDA